MKDPLELMKNPELMKKGQNIGLVEYSPFEFSKPGFYRMWIQVKIKGKVSKSSFNILVE